MNPILKSTALCLAIFAGAALTAGADETRDKVLANFIEADANADGALTMDEFTRLIDLNAADGIGRARMVQRNGRYGEAFGRLDANGDKKIDADEIAAIAERN